jgi:hypothetical protein
VPPEKFVTKIIVKDTKQLHSGRTKAGGQYTIWQIVATKPDGVPISHNLRAFGDLPRNEVIEVECELYRSEQYGDSYTVQRKGGSNSSKLAKDVSDLQRRVGELEMRLGELLRDERPSAATPPPTPPPSPPPAPPATPPTTPPATPPPAPAPAPAPVGDLPRDDDIPF